MRAGLVPPGPEILYVEDVNDLKETSAPINLVEKNGLSLSGSLLLDTREVLYASS